jgi:hypothetical protein
MTVATRVQERRRARITASAVEGRFCFFSDPDGNGWSVHGPAG